MSAPIAARGLADLADTSTPADTLTLSHEARHLRREVVICDNGLSVLIDLPHATVLEEGDRLALEDGRVVAVFAAPEALLEITARDAQHLTRLAWHLGNRHLACQIESGRLLIQRDHVIADMLTRLGALVQEVEAPFTPEGGAYGHGHAHGHGH